MYTQEGLVASNPDTKDFVFNQTMLRIRDPDVSVDFYAMQYSLLINNVVEALGGVLFLVTAVYIIRDKLKCDRYIAGK